MWILVYENQFVTGAKASPVPHSDRNSNDSNVLDNCSPFLWSCLAIFFLSFCSILMGCQPQAPFLQADRVEAWMLNNARKLGVVRKVLKHQVASQSFHASLQLTTAIALADVLQKMKITISTLTPANEIHMEKIFRAWKCRCNNLDVDTDNKLALVDRLQRRKCDYRSNLPISDIFCTIKAILERLF